MTDWIEHTGDTCPVDPETVVEVRCSDGKVVYDMKALFWDWATKGEVWSITHYRIVTPAKPPEPEEDEAYLEEAQRQADREYSAYKHGVADGRAHLEPDFVNLRLECLKLALQETSKIPMAKKIADDLLHYVLNGSVDKA